MDDSGDLAGSRRTGAGARAVAGLLLVVAVLLGLVAGLGALWAAAEASGNRYVAVTAAAPALAGVTWWLCRAALRRVAGPRVRRWAPIAVAVVELAAVAVPVAGLLSGGPPDRPIAAA
uniref:hypothetical protein n=1 Tax=Nonomuraea ceibae TaxID=1935170 RepID=UPI001C5EB74E